MMLDRFIELQISDLRFQISRVARSQAQSEIGNLQSAINYRQLRSLEAT
jgi:nitrate/nitrite-specific signal transduction histidine kinase